MYRVELSTVPLLMLIPGLGLGDLGSAKKLRPKVLWDYKIYTYLSSNTVK